MANKAKTLRSGWLPYLNLTPYTLISKQDYVQTDFHLPAAQASFDQTQLLSDWGCSIYAAFHALLALGVETSLSEVTKRGIAYGANPKIGGDYRVIKKICQSYGCSTTDMTIYNPRDLASHLDSNRVAITSLTKHYPSAGFEEHWVVASGVNDLGIEILDSDERSDTKTFGSYVLTPQGFQKSCFCVYRGWWLPNRLSVIMARIYFGEFIIITKKQSPV